MNSYVSSMLLNPANFIQPFCVSGLIRKGKIKVKVMLNSANLTQPFYESGLIKKDKDKGDVKLC